MVLRAAKVKCLGVVQVEGEDGSSVRTGGGWSSDLQQWLCAKAHVLEPRPSCDRMDNCGRVDIDPERYRAKGSFVSFKSCSAQLRNMQTLESCNPEIVGKRLGHVSSELYSSVMPTVQDVAVEIMGRSSHALQEVAEEVTFD